jgi:hypothetical protein
MAPGPRLATPANVRKLDALRLAANAHQLTLGCAAFCAALVCKKMSLHESMHNSEAGGVF